MSNYLVVTTPRVCSHGRQATPVAQVFPDCEYMGDDLEYQGNDKVWPIGKLRANLSCAEIRIWLKM